MAADLQSQSRQYLTSWEFLQVGPLNWIEKLDVIMIFFSWGPTDYLQKHNFIIQFTNFDKLDQNIFLFLGH